MDQTSTPAYEYMIQIMVLGSTNIGKTAMIKGYCTNVYSPRPELATIGFDFRAKKLVVHGKAISLYIWDTPVSLDLGSSQERPVLILKGVNGVILAYSILRRDAFGETKRILKALEDRGFGDTPKVLVGIGIEQDEYDPEKEDQELRRVVSYDEAEEFAEENGMLYFEVSARNGKNIEQPFESLVEKLVKEWESGNKKSLYQKTLQLQNQEKSIQCKCASCGP